MLYINKIFCGCSYLLSISIKVFVREKNPQQKKERAAEIFFNEIKHQTSKIYKNGGWLKGSGGGGGVGWGGAGEHVQGPGTLT